MSRPLLDQSLLNDFRALGQRLATGHARNNESGRAGRALLGCLAEIDRLRDALRDTQTLPVYACPDEVPYTLPREGLVNLDALRQAWDSHQARLKQWLVDAGFDGPRTGDILRQPMADGYAEYMLADGAEPMLINLPYADAWHDPDVAYLPYAEVCRRIDRGKVIAAMLP